MDNPETHSSSAHQTYQTALNQLIEWGAVMLLICLVFIALLPLYPAVNKPGTMLDIEMLLKERKPLIFIYILGLLGMFYAYWRIVRLLYHFPAEHAAQEKKLRAWVIGIGAACGLILLNLYPVTAIDVATYMIRARMVVLYGANPITALPDDYPNDPYVVMTGEYSSEPSPYGPLWELVAQIPVLLGVREIGGGIVAMKLISLIAYVGTAVLFGWYAQQDNPNLKINGATAAAFFALNPFVLLQAIGNGHNDMFAMFFLAAGLILWQREKWAWAALLFTVSTLVKLTGIIVLPLFGIAVLVNAPNWRARLLRGLGVAAIFITATLILYGMMGPFPEVFSGVRKAMFGRQGYSPPYAVLVLSWDFFPKLGEYILPAFRYLFVAYYLYLLVALALKRLTFIQAGFMAYFIQLFCGSVFRIWYPLWLLPFAALELNARTYWRAFLFSLTSELSILSYFVLWRWVWRYVEWGPYLFGKSWEYWRVMTLFTVSWTFGLPFFGGLFAKKDNPLAGKFSAG